VLDEYHEMIRNERGTKSTPSNGRDRRLRAIGPQTGQLINIIARSLERPTILELGTSYGYSGIWLAEAARATGGRLITMEILEYKSAFAHEMSEKAGLSPYIDFKVGDALKMITELKTAVDFVLIDLWKDLYVPCLRAVMTKLNPGAILIADNIGFNRADTRDYVYTIRAMRELTSVSMPVGQGLEISRYKAA
jgi:predicted O-methyltransferase YrrM